jgi:Concanavalin A-like lectin/glucanases superfamily
VTVRFVARCAWVVIVGAPACGVSVGQPIGFGVAPVAEAGPGAPEGGGDAPAEAKGDALTEGLVAHWRLDEERATDVVVDSSERGNSGIAVNGPLPSSSLPPVKFTDKMSRTFDGVGQYVAIGNSDVLNFEGAITIAAWVNINAINESCQVILGHGFRQDLMQEVSLRLSTTGCSGGGGAPHTWAVGAWDGTNHFAEAPLDDLDRAVWIHIVGVYDGSMWHLYRNGEEIGRQETTVGAIRVDADWAIGARGPSVPAAPARFFDGSIDDVRIYRRSLSSAEVLELYHH